MSENHPTRRDVLMSLAALPVLASMLEAQTGASSLCFMSAVEMARLIRAKKLSAREALTAHLTQIERVNPKVNAIVTLVPELAAAAAARVPAAVISAHTHGTYGHRIGALLESYAMAKGHAGRGAKLELLQGTLDLMVLQTLDTMGPQHGYGIARRIEQMSDAILKLNEGTVYAALMRLQHQRWISANWGTSDANRKAKFYAITVAGKRQLAREVEAWDLLAGLVARLRAAEQG